MSFDRQSAELMHGNRTYHFGNTLNNVLQINGAEAECDFFAAKNSFAKMLTASLSSLDF